MAERMRLARARTPGAPLRLLASGVAQRHSLVVVLPDIVAQANAPEALRVSFLRDSKLITANTARLAHVTPSKGAVYELSAVLLNRAMLGYQSLHASVVHPSGTTLYVRFELVWRAAPRLAAVLLALAMPAASMRLSPVLARLPSAWTPYWVCLLLVVGGVQFVLLFGTIKRVWNDLRGVPASDVAGVRGVMLSPSWALAWCAILLVAGALGPRLFVQVHNATGKALSVSIAAGAAIELADNSIIMLPSWSGALPARVQDALGSERVAIACPSGQRPTQTSPCAEECSTPPDLTGIALGIYGVREAYSIRPRWVPWGHLMRGHLRAGLPAGVREGFAGALCIPADAALRAALKAEINLDAVEGRTNGSQLPARIATVRTGDVAHGVDAFVESRAAEFGLSMAEIRVGSLDRGCGDTALVLQIEPVAHTPADPSHPANALWPLGVERVSVLLPKGWTGTVRVPLPPSERVRITPTCGMDPVTPPTGNLTCLVPAPRVWVLAAPSSLRSIDVEGIFRWEQVAAGTIAMLVCDAGPKGSMPLRAAIELAPGAWESTHFELPSSVAPVLTEVHISGAPGALEGTMTLPRSGARGDDRAAAMMLFAACEKLATAPCSSRIGAAMTLDTKASLGGAWQTWSTWAPSKQRSTELGWFWGPTEWNAERLALQGLTRTRASPGALLDQCILDEATRSVLIPGVYARDVRPLPAGQANDAVVLGCDPETAQIGKRM